MDPTSDLYLHKLDSPERAMTAWENALREDPVQLKRLRPCTNCIGRRVDGTPSPP